MKPFVRKCCWAGISAIGMAAVVGCGTVKSRYYDFDETGERDNRRLRGLPATIEVPTHLRLEIVETHHYKLVGAVAGDATKPGNYEYLSIPSRQLKYDFITMKELYTVDFKRPAAGSITLGVKYDPKTQYFTEISQATVDDSIAKIAALVQTAVSVAPQLAKAAGKNDPAGDDINKSLVTIPHVVSWQVFDLRQPGIEARVQEFLDQYINQCTRQCGPNGCPTPTAKPTAPTGLPAPVVALPASNPASQLR